METSEGEPTAGRGRQRELCVCRGEGGGPRKSGERGTIEGKGHLHNIKLRMNGFQHIPVQTLYPASPVVVFTHVHELLGCSGITHVCERSHTQNIPASREEELGSSVREHRL